MSDEIVKQCEFIEWLKANHIYNPMDSAATMRKAQLVYETALNTRQSSEWVSVDYGRKIGNLPKHNQEVLFIEGALCHAGVFINDYDRLSDTGDFGFFDNRDNFYEVDSVSHWMPQPPITESGDD